MAQVKTVFSVIDDASNTLSAIGNQMQGIARKISSVSQSLFFWREAISTIKGVFGQAYDYLIQRNEQMNQQILSSQASLVAVSNIFKNGFQITDTTQAIQSLAPKIKATLDQIQKDSLALVGVTSQQLNEPFQILLTNAQQISGQSVVFKDSIAAAGKLVPAFAATLGTLQIPLFQANQEITSIAQSTIDMNSKLAKSLGITNDMVNSWKGQGIFVDKLLEKMDSFVKGNALAANSIGGISSNIQEVLELVTRRVGSDLMQPVIDSLNYVYGLLQANQKNIEDTLGQGIRFLIDLGSKLNEAFQPLMPVLFSVSEAVGKILGAGLEVVGRQLMMMAEGFKIATTVSAPFLQSIGTILNVLGNFLNSPIRQILLQLKLAELTFKSINPVLSTFGNTLASIFPQLSQLQNLNLSNIGQSLQGLSSLGSTSITGSLSKSVIGIAQDISKSYIDLRGEVMKLIPDLKGKLPDLQPFFDGFVNGTNNIGAAIDTAKGKITDFSNSVTSAIANPDRTIKDFGTKIQLLGAGIANIASGIPNKLNSALSNVSNSLNTLPSSLSTLKTGIEKTFLDTFNGLPKGVQSSLEGIKATIGQSQIWQGLSGKFDIVSQQIKTQFASTITNIQAQISTLQTSPSFQKFSTGLQNSFQAIGQQVANLGINTQAFGGRLTGVMGLINSSVSGLTGKYTALGGVLKGLKPSPALMEMAGGMATAALFAGAISSVSLAFDTYNKLMEASSKNTKEFAKSTQLAIDKLKQLEAERGKISTTDQTREQSRLKEIEESQNWLEKFRDTSIRGIRAIPGLNGGISNLQKLMGGEGGGIQTGSESQLNAESEDFSNLITENDKFVAERKKSLDELTKSYKDLKAQKDQGIITEEKYQLKVKALDEEFDQHVAVVNTAIEKMKSFKPPTEAAAAAQAQMIKELERFKNKVTDINNVEIRPKDLPELGNTLKQLAKSAADAQRIMGFGNEEAVKKIKAEVKGLETELQEAEKAGDTARAESLKAKIQMLDKQLTQLGGTGDPVQFKKAAEELIATTKTQVEQGGISLKEAESRFKRLSELTTLDKDSQLKALAELRAVRKKAEEEIQKNLELRQQQIESFAQAGYISEAKAQQQINELKKKGAEEKLENIRKQILEEEAAGRGSSEFAKQLRQQEKQTQIEITKIEAEGIKQRREQRLKDYDEQIQMLESRKKRNLISEAKYQQELLDIQRKKAGEQLSQIKEKRQTLDPNDKEGQEALNAEEAKALGELASAEEEYRKNRREAQLKLFDDEQKILDSKNKNRLISETQYAKQSLDITKRRGEAEIRQIEEDIARTPKDDVEKLKALEARRAEIIGNIAAKEKEVNDKINEEKLKSFDNQEAILKASYDRRLMSESEYLKKSLEITRAKVNEELKQIAEARKKLAPGDKTAAEALDVRQAEALAKLAKQEEDVRQKQNQIRLQHYDNLQKGLDASLAKNLISEDDYAKKSLTLTRQKGAEELKQIAADKARLAATDKEGREALEAKANEVRKRIADAEKKERERVRAERLKDYDEQIQILESGFKRRLMTTAKYQAELLKLEEGRGNEKLKQVEQKRKELAPGDKQGREALDVEEAKALAEIEDAREKYRQNRRQAELKLYDDTQKIVDAKLKRRLITENDYAKQSLEILKKRGEAEIRQIEQDIARTPKGDIEKLKELQAKREEILANIAAKEKEINDKLNEEKLAAFDRQESILRANYDRRLISESEYLQKSLAISKSKLNEELRQVAEARKKLLPNDKTGAEQLNIREAEALAKFAKQEEEVRQKQAQLRLQHYDNLQKGLELSLVKNLISEESYAKKSLTLTKQRGAEELKQIEADKAKLAASDKSGIEALEAKANEVRKRIAEAEKKERERVRAERIKDYDEQIQLLESSNKRRLISTAQYQAELLKLEESRANERLKQIAERRSGLAPGDKQGQESLAVEEAKILAEIEDAREKYRQNRRQAELKFYDDEQKILDSRLKQRLITEKDYAKESLAITKQKGASEIKQIEEDIARTPKNDIEKLKALEARRLEIIANIKAKEKEIVEKANEEIMREIEISQSKALDKLTELDIQRQISLNSLIREGRVSRNTAREEELQAARERLNIELQGEQQRLAALQSINPYSDPKTEEERQKNIRQSRIKTLQLTQQLFKNQFDTEDYYIELAYKRRKESIDKQQADSQRSLENRLRTEEFISQSIERQSKAREQFYNLEKAIFNASQQEYSIAASLTDDEEEKKQIELEAARARIENIRMELAYQKESLQIEKAKLDSARERKKIELEMQSVTQTSETEKLQVDLQNLIDTGADKLEIIRKEREIEMSQRKESYIQYQLYLNEQQKSIDEREIAFKDRMLSLEYFSKENTAVAELAKKTDDLLDDAIAKNQALQAARNLNEFAPGMGSAVNAYYQNLPEEVNLKSFEEWSKNIKDNTEAIKDIKTENNKQIQATTELTNTFKNPPKPITSGLGNAGDIIKLNNNSSEIASELTDGYKALVNNQGKGISTVNTSIVRMNQDLVDSIVSLQSTDQNNTIGLIGALLNSQGSVGDNQLNNYFTNNFYGNNANETAQQTARQIQDQSLATLNKFVRAITNR